MTNHSAVLPPSSSTRSLRTPSACFAILGLALLLTPGFAGAQEETLVEEEIVIDEGDRESGSPTVLAQFTSGIEEREPIDQVTFVESSTEKIFFFSDLRGFEGETVTHRWLLQGEPMAEVKFEVRGPRWRVWSSKALRSEWAGDWTVEIVTSQGEVVAAETFTFTAPDA